MIGLEPYIICGAPGGGTSYFTKFLRYNGFYAGKSIEDGRNDKEHKGYIRAKKWHESILIAKFLTAPLSLFIGVFHDMVVDPKVEPSYYRSRRKLINSYSKKFWLDLIEDNKKDLHLLFNDEFELQNGPYGWKDPRNVYLLPLWRIIFPKGKILTVERKINPNPSSFGTEGKNFAKHANNEDFRKLFYGHKDDFRFQFEDFDNVNKVNELLNFVGLKTLTQAELTEILKDTEFDYSKIGKG